MTGPRPEDSPYPKADLTLRALARLTDMGLAIGVANAAGQMGAILAAVYLLAADGLAHGQSIGKRIFGVRVMVRPAAPGLRGRPAGYRESLLRNAPLALAVLFYGVPQFWLVLFLAGVPVLAWETWRVWIDPLGIRLGDLFGDTQVVDGKVISKIEVVATHHELRTVAPVPPAPGATASGPARLS